VTKQQKEQFEQLWDHFWGEVERAAVYGGEKELKIVLQKGQNDMKSFIGSVICPDPNQVSL
jgi:hypothetical protein